jgi:hypothetical protein
MVISFVLRAIRAVINVIVQLVQSFVRIVIDLGVKSWLLILSALAWSLWFGGTIATFVIGLSLFKWLSHDDAAAAANVMFEVFTKYELVLAAITITGAGMLLVGYPSKRMIAMLFVLFLSGGMMVIATLGVMPQMKQEADKKSEHWKQLHGRFMIVQSMQALTLASVVIPLIAAADPTFRRREKLLDDAVEPVLPKRGGLLQRV